MKIYIVIRDSAYQYDQEITVLGVSLTLQGALDIFTPEAQQAKAAAIECSQVCNESPDGLSVETYKDGCAAEEHLNVFIVIKDVNDDRYIVDKLSGCLATLREIAQSGYVPYTSPAPSTTESILRGQIDGAAERLENAVYFHKSLYGDASNCNTSSSRA